MPDNTGSVDESTRLKITEVFYSLQGESSRVGIPTTFIRLTGCPLRCQYCDTAYAFSGGQSLSFSQILEQVAQYNTRYITVTGGEPLAQKDCLTLLTLLCDSNYQVSLETSGAVDISSVDSRVVKIMDLKTPASGEEGKNLWSNLDHLQAKDEIKFVLCNRNDYDWACSIVQQYRLTKKASVLFSPSFEQLNATELADWILQDQLDVRLQLQLHKLLWGNLRGH